MKVVNAWHKCDMMLVMTTDVSFVFVFTNDKVSSTTVLGVLLCYNNCADVCDSKSNSH